MDAPTVLPTPAAPQQPRLLDLLRQRIRVLHYSIRTEQAYVDWPAALFCFTASAIRVTWGRQR